MIDIEAVSARASCSTGAVPGLPVIMCRVGERATITRISGREDTKKFLAGLGFLVGSSVTVVSRAGNNLILEVKGSKIAIDGQMASKIIVDPERWYSGDTGRDINRKDGQGRQDPRRGRCQAPRHGHGHHQGMPGVRQEGRPPGRPDRDNRPRIRAHAQEDRGRHDRSRKPLKRSRIAPLLLFWAMPGNRR